MLKGAFKATEISLEIFVVIAVFHLNFVYIILPNMTLKKNAFIYYVSTISFSS
jgi:hypothetical protein